MWRRILVISIVFAMALLAVGACRNAGRYLQKEELGAHADAMVMLQGSVADRVLQCVDLYHEGMAPRILLVEENMYALDALRNRGVWIPSKTEEVARYMRELGVSSHRIELIPGGARSTLDEAIYVRAWLADHPEITSIVLVSSAHHMRRASLIFSVVMKELPHPPQVYSMPSKYDSQGADRWWRSKEGIQIVLSEYLKIVSFRLLERRSIPAWE